MKAAGRQADLWESYSTNIPPMVAAGGSGGKWGAG